MPRGDGTGPRGRGTGRGAGRGMGQGRQTGGNCVCPNCGAQAAHQVGVPCYEQKCPKCGTGMVRE